jgi:hypothetical protein
MTEDDSMLSGLRTSSGRRAGEGWQIMLLLLLLLLAPLSNCGNSGPSCEPSKLTCASASSLGEVEGDDTTTVPITTKGSGSSFVSARITEVSWDNRSISVRGTITPTGTAKYDLLLYVDKNNDASGCGLAPIAATNGVVDANWPDLYDGSSQDRTVVFEIRHRSGVCDGGWQLKIEGNTTSVTAP